MSTKIAHYYLKIIAKEYRVHIFLVILIN